MWGPIPDKSTKELLERTYSFLTLCFFSHPSVYSISFIHISLHVCISILQHQITLFFSFFLTLLQLYTTLHIAHFFFLFAFLTLNKKKIASHKQQTTNALVPCSCAKKKIEKMMQVHAVFCSETQEKKVKKEGASVKPCKVACNMPNITT